LVCESFLFFQTTFQNSFQSLFRDETDVHGVAGGVYATDCWVLSSVIYHCGGDSIQFNGDAVTLEESPTRFYICDNDGGRCGENFFDIKLSQEVFCIGNRYGGYRGISNLTGSGSDGAATVLHDGGINMWICKNWICDSNAGIRANGTSIAYLEGNVIHHIYGADADSAIYAGIIVFNNDETHVVNNTLYSCDGGIEISNGIGMITSCLGNLLVNINSANPYIEMSSAVIATLQEFDYNFYDAEAVILYSGSLRSLAYMKANTSWSEHSDEGVSYTTETSSGHLTLDSNSPCLNISAASPIYATFQSMYGRSLAYDILGTARPSLNGWDIGAVEIAEAPNAPAGGTARSPAAVNATPVAVRRVFGPVSLRR
jgi:hypothetical protein